METTTIITPQKKISFKDFKEIWRYRELLYFFTWRDLKVRYKQTVIGVLWAIFQPFFAMVVFSVFLGKLAKMPSDGIPYPVFVYTGLLFWQFFSSALTEASGSLISNQAIFTKTYFPRLILPISSVIPHLVDFLIASLVLIGLMIYYHYALSLIGFLMVPLLILITFVTAAGTGMILAAINIKYRDVRYILPFFIQMLMFVTPVIYPASILQNYSWILAINPMTGVINAARAAILGTTSVDWHLLFISGFIALAMLILGIIYFKKTEKYFVDLV